MNMSQRANSITLEKSLFENSENMRAEQLWINDDQRPFSADSALLYIT